MCSASSVEDAVCRRYGVVSTSPPGLTSTMDVIVIVCHEFELTVSEKQADAMHLWSDPSTASNALLLGAAGQQYEQTTDKLAPNSSHLTRGLIKYVPGWGYFRAVSF